MSVNHGVSSPAVPGPDMVNMTRGKGGVPAGACTFDTRSGTFACSSWSLDRHCQAHHHSVVVVVVVFFAMATLSVVNSSLVGIRLLS
jgi:hypothetical protein